MDSRGRRPPARIGLDKSFPDAQNRPMKIRVNGEEMNFPDGLTIAALLEFLHIPLSGRAVAVNLTFVPKPRHARHVLADGDEVEVVAPMQGG